MQCHSKPLCSPFICTVLSSLQCPTSWLVTDSFILLINFFSFHHHTVPCPIHSGHLQVATSFCTDCCACQQSCRRVIVMCHRFSISFILILKCLSMPLYLDLVSLACVHAHCIYPCHSGFFYTFIPAPLYHPLCCPTILPTLNIILTWFQEL